MRIRHIKILGHRKVWLAQALCLLLRRLDSTLRHKRDTLGSEAGG